MPAAVWCQFTVCQRQRTVQPILDAESIHKHTHSISKYALCNYLSTYDFDWLSSIIWVKLDALEHIHFKVFAYMVKGHQIPFKSISTLRFFCVSTFSQFKSSITKMVVWWQKWQWLYSILRWWCRQKVANWNKKSVLCRVSQKQNKKNSRVW